jgi:hypothetical protein
MLFFAILGAALGLAFGIWIRPLFGYSHHLSWFISLLIYVGYPLMGAWLGFSLGLTVRSMFRK